uniref:TSA: Wollemia nobilis Ref_Wollemi_Transcript_11815_733 transcribed RNA sequence n=1 Tax=Wollemia nobilis TaxID=56998 RepID=A0A0C9S653_9CONI
MAEPMASYEDYGEIWHPYWNPLYFYALVNLRRTYAHGMTPFTEDPARLPIDWRETTEAHVFSAALPGARKEDIRVELEDARYLRIASERERGNCERKFRLPEQVDVESITAKFEDGVLSVVVPKIPSGAARRITPADIQEQHSSVANAA